MIDHIFLTVSDMDRSVSFYEKALQPLGLTYIGDFDGSAGPEGHPDLKGFGRGTSHGLWLRNGVSEGRRRPRGFVATPKQQSTPPTKPRSPPAPRTTVPPPNAPTTPRLLRRKRVRPRRLQPRIRLQTLAVLTRPQGLGRFDLAWDPLRRLQADYAGMPEGMDNVDPGHHIALAGCSLSE